MTLVLVVGSYPPIPVPAAGATVDAVRWVWEAGDEVCVVSPRPSAAHYAVPVTGWFAGRRLRRLQQMTGATELVLCVEPGVPFDGRAAPLGSVTAALAARLLARAMRAFDRATVVVTSPAAGPAPAIAALRRAAATVVEDPRPGTPPPTVTVLGPEEVTASVRARRYVDRAGRLVFGRRWGAVRHPIAAIRRRRAA